MTTSSSSSSSSSSDKVDTFSALYNQSLLDKNERAEGLLKGRGIKHLERFEYAIRFFAVIAVVLLVATIAFLALAQADYIHPLAALYAFGGFVATFIVIKAIDCCQNCVAKKHHLDLQEDFYAVKQPAIKKKVRKIDDEI